MLKLCSIIVIFTAFTSHASLFNEAKKSIVRHGNLSDYTFLKNELTYPYLQVAYYQKRLFLDTEIANFLKANGNIPAAITLQKKWLIDLFKRGQYQTVVSNYTHTEDNEINCAYKSALLQLGHKQQALKNIQSLWMSESSLPDSCDLVFDVWQDRYNSKYIDQRAKLAYLATNYDLAIHLANQSNTQESFVISQFAEYAKRPKLLVNTPKSLLTKTPLHLELLPNALLSLAKKNSVAHADFILSFASQVNNTRYQKTLQSLTQYLAKRNSFLAKKSYQVLSLKTKTVTESLLFYLVKKEDWQGILNSIPFDTPFVISQYWLAKALEKNQQFKRANQLLKRLAQTRSYYGFLAADQLNQPYQFNVKPIQPNTKRQRNFNQHPALNRAIALRAQQAPKLATQEITHFAKKLDVNDTKQLALWLHQHQFFFEAIYLLGKLKSWDHLLTRFPIAYEDIVGKHSQSKYIHPTWIYAITRQETSMNPHAVSRSNAKGLMQLIPSTARLVARDLGLYVNGNNVFDPQINIALGSEYLRQMKQNFGNIAMASAAYNAGPGRVEKWLQTNSISDMPLWVEKIPFNETRKYVKRVLEYQQVYAHLLRLNVPKVSTIIYQ